MKVAYRLKLNGVWRNEVSTDHCQIYHQLSERCTLFSMPVDNRVPIVSFGRKYDVLIPERDQWLSLENLITGYQHTFYTDGSKTSDGSGPGCYLDENTKYSYATGQMATVFLTEVHIIIPDKWKVGRVVPLMKPEKPADQGEIYRPITLLSSVLKTLEAPAQHLHGFRRVNSTTTALTAINPQMNRGLSTNRPCQKTVLVALDLKKAFQPVNNSTLLVDIYQSTLPPGLTRSSAHYVSGRHASVILRDQTSKQRKIEQGVPQGGDLSPLLFNFYNSKLPQPPEKSSWSHTLTTAR